MPVFTASFVPSKQFSAFYDRNKIYLNIYIYMYVCINIYIINLLKYIYICIYIYILIFSGLTDIFKEVSIYQSLVLLGTIQL